ncbi:aminodeoxychorismate synthase component I [Carnimonas bestiolae]|uniref:aminodeoxychorismate synthase component I n=1 Tax=Carnimonas bestiolae TaxID=3402172 RepID=UPI003EDC56E2
MAAAAYRITSIATPLDYSPTPIHYFSALKHLTGAVLLDSGAPSDIAGRFDIISAMPLATLTTNAHGQAHCDSHASLSQYPIAAQRELLGLLECDREQVPEHLPFAAGLLGAWSYDFGRLLEQLAVSQNEGDPIAWCGLYDWALVQDHHLQQSWLIATPERRDQVVALLESAHENTDAPFALTSSFEPLISRAQYDAAFAQVKHYIDAGDCYQINLTQAFSARYQGDEWSAYQRLRAATPSPFSAMMKIGDTWLLSVSPERFIRVTDHDVIAQPIKGTRKRGSTLEEDQRLAAELENSLKDRAENVMIVDLLRNDLGRACAIGSVKVPMLAERIGYANVHHLVSTVSGRLAAHRDVHDLLAASLPGGSITGAPKHRAMEIIDELEAAARGYYCGSIGYIDSRGNMDTSIAIRTAQTSAGRITLWGGGGIVADSAGEDEYLESVAKINSLMQALTDQPATALC